MKNERFFDQILEMIERGNTAQAMMLLTGKLYNAVEDSKSWPQTRADLRQHTLYNVLLEDPFTGHSARRPRGYPGDAALIDIIYDKTSPEPMTRRGREVFNVSVAFQPSEAVRLRRAYAETLVTKAWAEGKRILVLACGHFREGDALIGKDITNITLVDQDEESLAVIRRNHGDGADLQAANVVRYLRAAVARGDQFDLIYTLGLTDYLEDRTMDLLHRLAKASLAPNGVFLLANFLPGHLSVGWMDAVMDWQLIYRDEAELTAFADAIGLAARTWRDETDSIVFCEMTAPG